MSEIKSNPQKKKKNNSPVEEYDNLLSELQEMNQPLEQPVQNDDNASLKSRAQQLLVWITRHKNHVDRHELADICKEGMKIIMKIMKATGKTDTIELDFELMVLEARKIACEEAFAEDLKGFDNITSDILSSLTPDLQASIKSRIAKAKSNIYTTSDTPENIIDEIESGRNRVIDNRVDDIIEPYFKRLPLKKCTVVKEELREYIRERIDYTDKFILTDLVSNLINDFERQCYLPGYDYLHFPGSIEQFIQDYNRVVDDLRRRIPEESRKYTHIDIDDFHLGRWTLKGNEVQIEFKKYYDWLVEMKRLISHN